MGENLRWNGSWLIYRLPKPSHTGQTFIQLEPLDFLERISKLVPYPRRHRRHYQGVLAPGSPLRKKVIACSQKIPNDAAMQVSAKKASLNWAKLIARIYEVDPLICSDCGSEIKIVFFVVHSAQIRRILSGIPWPTETPEFDPPNEAVCQLDHGTADGFPAMENQVHYDAEAQVHDDSGPDPPHPEESYDRPHEDYCDPPHWDN